MALLHLSVKKTKVILLYFVSAVGQHIHRNELGVYFLLRLTLQKSPKLQTEVNLLRWVYCSQEWLPVTGEDRLASSLKFWQDEAHGCVTLCC